MSDVYFLFAPKANVIKIGVASNPLKRVRGLQTPEPCRLVGLMPNVGVEGEQALHGDFRHLRVHGEWFRATSELRSYVERHAADVPFDAWKPVSKKNPAVRRRESSRIRRTPHPQAGHGRRNRAIEAAAEDRMFYVYECYSDSGEFLFAARTIDPSAHWIQQVRYAQRDWASDVARFSVRGPYTKRKAAELYADAVNRDPVHVSSAPTAKATDAARRHFFEVGIRARMELGDSWEQAIVPVLEEADAIDFRSLVSEQTKAATCTNR
ncbi:GIY-YIG nuclease family protein [Rhodococcus sp. 1168]|uniref:GIY-YIG nuclease family protein n=1 Tax=Rhodococcus sp. 1168 TaxID=2018041 RepID=UPI000A0CF5B8|nr:GIY-YIG nuclease family protein [Rhodococcus sp. 1168]ORI13473.1 hypothetical protein BJI47_22785 [Rhodococcus sp. 1168]